ncbi:hypothetical protein F2P81_023116 [Scophthalmus maximus]|uniref:Uncharacterized protein n=1 Tax=Scophthalmus maximus TaxID=52904 RepID=A0A6A4S1D4_SCOMX|nr:hypothetical protein F2P81_023116 [Scophthalmus maximus]
MSRRELRQIDGPGVFKDSTASNMFLESGRVAKLATASFELSVVPTIKTEPHDDYDAPLVCAQRGPAGSLHPKPYFPPQAMTPMLTSDLRPCVGGGGGGAYPVSQERLTATPAPLPSSSSSPSTSPKLHDLSPSHFSKGLPAGPPGPQSPLPHVSIIQETPGRYQLPSLYPPSSSSSSSSPTSQPSTPTDAPFSPAHCMTPAQPVSGSASPDVQQQQQQQQLAKVPERGRPSLQGDGGSPALAVSIKQEPQELDQMYLDDETKNNASQRGEKGVRRMKKHKPCGYQRTERRGPFDPSPEPPPNRLAPSFLMMASETRQPSGGRRLHDSDCSRATSSERSGGFPGSERWTVSVGSSCRGPPWNTGNQFLDYLVSNATVPLLTNSKVTEKTRLFPNSSTAPRVNEIIRNDLSSISVHSHA